MHWAGLSFLRRNIFPLHLPRKAIPIRRFPSSFAPFGRLERESGHKNGGGRGHSIFDFQSHFSHPLAAALFLAPRSSLSLRSWILEARAATLSHPPSRPSAFDAKPPPTLPPSPLRAWVQKLLCCFLSKQTPGGLAKKGISSHTHTLHLHLFPNFIAPSSQSPEVKKPRCRAICLFELRHCTTAIIL